MSVEGERLKETTVREWEPVSAPVIAAESPAMRRVVEQIGVIARSGARVILLSGETGSGKGVAARLLHAWSARAEGPFVPVSCTNLQETLLESELFGHERGAFTSAVALKRGLFELADGGTLFLDEIGDMSAPLQARFLRFVEDGRFRRVGGTDELRADVRIVAATHRDLFELARRDLFRSDLLFRLNVIEIRIPPLRERKEDFEPLVRQFIDALNGQYGDRIASIERPALERLVAHSWPGNVRELRNVAERAFLLAEDRTIHCGDIVFQGPADPVRADLFDLPESGVDLIAIQRRLESALIGKALERTGGNLRKTASLLGLTRDQLRYRIARYGLREDASGTGPRDAPAEKTPE